jgi:hypothetical protein
MDTSELNINKSNVREVKEKCQVEVTKEFAALKSLRG